MKPWLFAPAAAVIALAMSAVPASAQTWWMTPTAVNAGEGVVILAGPAGPYSAVVPIITTARTVRVGPVVRVSGCTWARERIPGRWIRFKVCGEPPLGW
jgi:hypothetical protein